MLKILRLYIVSILFLQLIGCTGVLYKQDQNDFRSGRKSIIIMQQYTQLQYGKQYPIFKTIWQNEQTGEMFDTWRSSSIDLYPKNGFLVYALDPGMYSLREVIAYPIESHNLSNMVSFSARPGEVVYIGDLILRGDLILDKKENALFLAQVLNVGDSFEDAKLFFKKRYSDIASVPVKRLMQLSEKVKKLQAITDK